jgi:signal peptidase II
MQRFVTVFGLIGISMLLDRYTKYLAIEELMNKPSMDILGTFFQLVYAENTGAFLSLGADFPDALRLIFLSILPSILLLSMLAYTLFSKELSRLQVIALSLICGGGMSNLYDRITEGMVVDFMILGVGVLRTGVFNIADVCIMTGLALMLPEYFKKPQKPEDSSINE